MAKKSRWIFFEILCNQVLTRLLTFHRNETVRVADRFPSAGFPIPTSLANRCPDRLCSNVLPPSPRGPGAFQRSSRCCYAEDELLLAGQEANLLRAAHKGPKVRKAGKYADLRTGIRCRVRLAGAPSGQERSRRAGPRPALGGRLPPESSSVTKFEGHSCSEDRSFSH